MISKGLKKSIPILLAVLFIVLGIAKDSYAQCTTGDAVQDAICRAAFNINTDPEKIKDLQDQITSMSNEEKKVARKNYECQVDKNFEDFKKSCYSCMVVKSLISAFMTAAPKIQSTVIQASVIVLALGAMLAMTFTVFKYMASLVQVEPMEEVKVLLSILFKSTVAYFFIVEGVDALVHYIINPILMIGTDYGLGIIGTVGDMLNLPPDIDPNNLADGAANYAITSAVGVDPAVMNNIVSLNRAIDYFTSTNMALGNALMCHATHAGRVVLLEALKLGLPDIWIWLVGLVIWAFGFALTLGVSFYLLDISFKLGLAIILLPLGIAFWPFSATQDKLVAVISLILKSAAIFAFLAITVSYGLVLISKAIGDLDILIFSLKYGLTKNISDTFAISGPYFLLIIFAYIYAMNLVEITEGAYVNKFFSSSLDPGSPMHAAATKGVGKATNMAKMAGGKAKNAGGKLAKGAANKVKGWAKDD